MEPNLDGQTPLSSYLDMKSNLVSTPYSTQQQHLNDWNNGELKITASENTNALQEREGNPWTHSGTLRRGPGKNRKFIQSNRMEAWESFTSRKGECVGTFETYQTESVSLMADLDKNRHDFLQTLRSFYSMTSFSSTNPPKTSLSANLLVQWKRAWHTGMKRRLRNTTTWRTESQKKAAEAWLESHCANSSLHWNFRRRLLKKLSPRLCTSKYPDKNDIRMIINSRIFLAKCFLLF